MPFRHWVDGTSGLSSQVTGATHTSQTNEGYSYDANGNRTNSGYSTGANNRLTSDGTYNYQYDAEGNRTRRTEIATGKYDTFAWDHHNRLTAVQSYTSAGVLTKQVQYTYDVYDRRIGPPRRIDTDGNGTWDTTQRFVYDGEDIVQAFSGSATGSLTNRYLVGPNTDEILSDEQVAGGTSTAVTWSLADNLGSVRDLVQYIPGTNTTTVVNHVVYDTFGQIKSQANPGAPGLFAYTGREWDADVGKYYYRARWWAGSSARTRLDSRRGM
jgi:YD repeat-containing protein